MAWTICTTYTTQTGDAWNSFRMQSTTTTTEKEEKKMFGANHYLFDFFFIDDGEK